MYKSAFEPSGPSGGSNGVFLLSLRRDANPLGGGGGGTVKGMVLEQFTLA